MLATCPSCTQGDLGVALPMQRREPLAPDAFPISQICKQARGAWCGHSQRGGLASTVAAQEGGDLVLVEVQAEPAEGRPWVARKALF